MQILLLTLPSTTASYNTKIGLRDADEHRFG